MRARAQEGGSESGKIADVSLLFAKSFRQNCTLTLELRRLFMNKESEGYLIVYK
jgi:hypothetical protein